MTKKEEFAAQGEDCARVGRRREGATGRFGRISRPGTGSAATASTEWSQFYEESVLPDQPPTKKTPSGT